MPDVFLAQSTKSHQVLTLSCRIHPNPTPRKRPLVALLGEEVVLVSGSLELIQEDGFLRGNINLLFWGRGSSCCGFYPPRASHFLQYFYPQVHVYINYWTVQEPSAW